MLLFPRYIYIIAPLRRGNQVKIFGLTLVLESDISFPTLYIYYSRSGCARQYVKIRIDISARHWYNRRAQAHVIFQLDTAARYWRPPTHPIFKCRQRRVNMQMRSIGKCVSFSFDAKIMPTHFVNRGKYVLTRIAPHVIMGRWSGEGGGAAK